MRSWWRCDLAPYSPVDTVCWIRCDTCHLGKLRVAGVQYGWTPLGRDYSLLCVRAGVVTVITALYSIMALANFAVASKDFHKGHKASGFAWLAMGFAWLLAVFILVSGLGVIS